MEVAIFIGLQGSGKSTFFRRHLAATHDLVSKDLMRNVRDKNRRQLEVIGAALRKGHSIAVDNTNPSAEDRAPLIALAKALNARVVGYFFAAPIRECIERNERREGRARVPLVAIYRTAKRMNPPAMAEGFDAVCRVALAGDEFRVGPLAKGTEASPGEKK